MLCQQILIVKIRSLFLIAKPTLQRVYFCGKQTYAEPLLFQVCTEGRLILEFTFDDLMRIKSWHFAVRTHRELIPRSVVVGMHSQQDANMLDQLSKNITRQGITNSTLNYLRVSSPFLQFIPFIGCCR